MAESLKKSNKILKKWGEIEEYTGLSVNTLKKLIQVGFPVTIYPGVEMVFSYTDNIDLFFQQTTMRGMKGITSIPEDVD